MKERTCSVPGCTSKHRARGLCNAHYQRAAKAGTIPVNRKHKSCSVQDCTRAPIALGMCSIHYRRKRRHGGTEKLPAVSGEKHHLYKHGLSWTRAWRCWIAMKARCLSEGSTAYPHYGAMGVTIHPPWIESFKAFYADMGPAPSEGHSLQRIDNDGHYVPGNVRWANSEDQARSRCSNRVVTYDGVSLCVADWADMTGIPYAALQARLKKGWSTHRAFTQPVRKTKHHPEIIPKPVSRDVLSFGSDS